MFTPQQSDPASSTSGHASTEVAIGVLAGPIVGLKYQTPTEAGLTGDQGEFSYQAGEAVTFLVSGVVLGSVTGSAGSTSPN